MINSIKFKKIMRWDNFQKLFRLFCLFWVVGNPKEVGFGKGAYAVKVTLALRPKLFDFSKSTGFYVNDGESELDAEFTVLGVRFSRVISYGGLFG